jgi:hypothetical protein
MPRRTPSPRPVAVKDVLQDLLKPGDREALELRRRIRQVWEAVAPAALQAQARLEPGIAIPQTPNPGGAGPGSGAGENQGRAGQGRGVLKAVISNQ